MTKYENFDISDLLDLITNHNSDLNVSLLRPTQVFLAWLSLSLGVNILVHRLIFLFKCNLRTHSNCRGQIFAIGPCICHRADLEGLLFVFEVSGVDRGRLVDVEGASDRRKEETLELTRVIFHAWLEEVIQVHPVSLHVLGLN